MRKLKIVTWNCNGAFRKKFSTLDKFDADLLVVQECEDPARSTDEFQCWANNYLWHGDTKNKGIGVFARDNVHLESLNWGDHGLQSFLPCRINGSTTLVGVWTKQTSPELLPYIGQL